MYLHSSETMIATKRIRKTKNYKQANKMLLQLLLPVCYSFHDEY